MNRDAIKSTFPTILVTLLIVLMCCMAVSYIPQIPYNVREILKGGNLVYNTFLISANLYVGFGLPAWLAMTLSRNVETMVLRLPFAILLQAALTWFLVRSVAPLESIDDILGSPVLDWPWEWELLMRFVGLFIVPSVLIVLSTLIMLSLPLRANALQSYYKIIYWLPGGLPLLALSHIIVVDFADTDNLTELMAGGGTIMSSIMVALWCLCLTYSASLLASRGAKKGPAKLGLRVLGALVVSAPVAYLLLMVGTEQHVSKYDQTFSALQFLLSQDRQHYVAGGELFLRFAIAHYGAITLLFLAQLPFWQVHFEMRARNRMTIMQKILD